MSKRSKKSYSAKLKFQIVLEALTSDKEDAEVARAYDVHPVSLSKLRVSSSTTENSGQRRNHHGCAQTHHLKIRGYE